MSDDPIDEIEWMTQSEKVMSKRRRRLHQEKLQRQRLAVASALGMGIIAGLLVLVFWS